MILENCKKRKRNLSSAWIDYKKAFDSVPHEWILRSLELFKVSPRVVGFLKHNMKNWKTQLTLTHESGTLMSDNINIKRGSSKETLYPHYSSAFHSYHSHWGWVLQATDIKSKLSGSPICFIWMI